MVDLKLNYEYLKQAIPEGSGWLLVVKNSQAQPLTDFLASGSYK